MMEIVLIAFLLVCTTIGAMVIGGVIGSMIGSYITNKWITINISTKENK